MTLSMKNYKGFDKLPYCGAHVPKAKATTVVDTPEMRRLAENSKIQVHCGKKIVPDRFAAKL
jgi:LIM and SH3 domain protein 1